MCGARWALVLQTSGLTPRDAVDCSYDFDEYRAQESELARIRSGAIEQSADAAHDVFVETRLEKLDLIERALRVSEQLLVFLRCRWWRVLARWREHACRIRGGEVQLVEGNQYRLRQIERRMAGCGNGNQHVRAIQNLVGKTLVFPAEQNRDGTAARKIEQLSAGLSRCRDISLRGATTCGEAGSSHYSLEGFVDRVTVFYAIDDVVGAVRNPRKSPWIVLDRSHEVEIRKPHVLHGADRSRDVHRVLRLVQDHTYAREDRTRSWRGFAADFVAGGGH